jgi:hypothetical protein
MNTLITQLDITKIYNSYLTKNWIKLINLEEYISFTNYDNNKYFTKVADVVLDKDIKDIKTNKKSRQTLIKFNFHLAKNEYTKKCEWLYIFTLNDKIIKIGGTRDSLFGRTQSYLCGHHIKERGKTNKCSVTNAYVYNTFEFYLQNGYKIEMYGYELPITTVKKTICDESIDIVCQTFHAYESVFIQKYKESTKCLPPLCDNSCPEYRD